MDDRVIRKIKTLNLPTSLKVLAVARVLTPETQVFTVSDVSKALGITPQATYMCLMRLAKKGLVTKLVRGAYVLTPKGLRVAEEILKSLTKYNKY